MYLIGIGSLLIIVSGILFSGEIYSGYWMSKIDKEKFLVLWKKEKSIRTEQEQKYIDATWSIYYLRKIRNTSFLIGTPLILIDIMIYIITK